MRLVFKTVLNHNKRDHYLAALKSRIDQYIPLDGSQYEVHVEIYTKR